MEMEMDFDSISNLENKFIRRTGQENRQKTLFKIKQSKLEAGGSGCAATAFFHFELQWRRQSPSCTLWMLYSRGIPKIKYQAMCQSRRGRCL